MAIRHIYNVARSRVYEVISLDICSVAVLVMLLGFVHYQLLARAQSQEAINARIEERIQAMKDRLDKMETAQNYGMGALVANLAAHMVQIRGQMRRRRKDEEEEEHV